MTGSAAETRKRIVEAAETLAPAWKELALRIHANPELGRQEEKAAAWLAEALEGSGFTVERETAMPTAFVALRDTKPDAPVIAFCAEYDSFPGLGHACGHNLIAVAACLAGHALATIIPSRVRVMGCPAEEGFGGKVEMLNHGVFEGIDFAMMAHGGPRNLPSRDMMGRIAVTMDFHGVSSPAVAAPDKGINALDAAVLAYGAVGLMRQQLRDGSRVQGIITKGGEYIGRIPDHAQAQFAVRSRDGVYIQELMRGVLSCAEGAAAATGCRLETSSPFHPMLPMRRNRALEDAYSRNLRLIGIEPDTWPPDRPIGSTDFGNVSQVVPGIHAYFKLGPDHITAHTPEFVEASRSEEGLAGMMSAAKAMALTGFDLTEDGELRAAVRRDFEAAGKGSAER